MFVIAVRRYSYRKRDEGGFSQSDLEIVFARGLQPPQSTLGVDDDTPNHT